MNGWMDDGCMYEIRPLLCDSIPFIYIFIYMSTNRIRETIPQALACRLCLDQLNSKRGSGSSGGSGGSV